VFSTELPSCDDPILQNLIDEFTPLVKIKNDPSSGSKGTPHLTDILFKPLSSLHDIVQTVQHCSRVADFSAE